MPETFVPETFIPETFISEAFTRKRSYRPIAAHMLEVAEHLQSSCSHVQLINAINSAPVAEEFFAAIHSSIEI